VTLRARVWQRGSSVPSWQVTGIDAGSQRITGAGALSLVGYTSTSSSGATLRFDDISATSSTAVTAPPPPAPAGASSGSAPVGGTSYPVPAGALFVAPTGSDAASGTSGSPLRSVARAITVARGGQTIVLRAGVYHEALTVPDGKTLTIQPYPSEAVWLDGSRVVAGWAQSGSVWRSDGWTTQFDSSPTFTRGAPDGTSANWQWVNPAYPMAAHPDQLWIGGKPQQQVSSLSKVTPGTFFADYPNKRLYVGTNPTGSTVRASDLQKALVIQAQGSVVRGLGIRNYAPSVPDLGAVSLQRPGVTLENVTVDSSATIGVSVQATDATLRNVTVTRSGLLGVHANYADRLVLDHARVDGNNAEHFNTTPVAGGVKITRSRTVSVLGGAYTANVGSGLWTDESTYDSRIVGNNLQRNTAFGFRAELSARVTVSNNLITGNGDDGVRIANTSGAKIWNNTIVGNKRSINMTQDSRLASDPNVPGHDPRQPFPDPTMTWLIGTASVGNNVLALQSPSANAMFAVEDFTHKRSASNMGISVNGNVYNRSGTAVPTWVVVWARAGTDPAVYKSVAPFVLAAGQERTALSVDGSAAVNSDFSLATAVASKTDATAQPLPADVASLVGQLSGTKHLGAWR
jgi:parallel beta-helix repeat protein